MGIEKLSIEDISRTNRYTLGDDVPVVVFRLLRIIGMNKILGDTAGTTLYILGKELGASLEVKSVEEFLDLVRDLKIGVAEIIESTDDRLVVFVKECITCSGLPDVGEMFCNFEGGIIAGALEKLLDRPTKAVQTKSGSSGFNGCEFEITLF